MEKQHFNNHGASLIEILAIITLATLLLSVVTNAITTNMRRNTLNQEQLVNFAVANSVANYIKSIPYEKLQTLVYVSEEEDTPSYVLLFNEQTCETLYQNAPEQQQFCLESIYPEINGRNYHEDVHIILLAYDHAPTIHDINEKNIYPILSERLNQLANIYPTSNEDEFNDDLIRIFVIVQSIYTETNDIVIEKVTTNEENKTLK